MEKNTFALPCWGWWRHSAFSAHAVNLEPTRPHPGWLRNYSGYRKARALQAETGLPCLIEVCGNRCGFCRAVNKCLFQQAAFRNGIRNIIKVRINPEHGRTSRKLVRRLGAPDYPGFLVIDRPGWKPRAIKLYEVSEGEIRVDDAETALEKIRI